MTAALEPPRTPTQRREERADAARRNRPRDGLRSAVLTAVPLLGMAVVVVAILLSQFGTVRAAASDIDAHDEAVGGAGPALGAPWEAVRGTWAVDVDGARVVEAGPQLSVAVRPVGGVDGTVEVEGTFGGDGWAVVVRWEGPGTYALVVVEPGDGTVSVVGVVQDRSRLLGQGTLPAGTVGDAGAVRVTLDGPVIEARVGDVLVAAGRHDDLTRGTSAGVAVLGDLPAARFTRFRTVPPEPATTHVVAPGGGS